MAKLKSSFTAKNATKVPLPGSDSSASGSVSKTAAPGDLAVRLLNPASSGTVVQPLNFGSLHTQTASTASQSGSLWTGLLNSASGGGASGLLGGSLLAGGALGFVGKLLALFSGSKSTPAAPVPFQKPVAQQQSLNVSVPGAASSVTLGVHTPSLSMQTLGIYQQSDSSVSDHNTPGIQVVQIVKQALLTSSSLNDVISEI